jgi:hypothetical protein
MDYRIFFFTCIAFMSLEIDRVNLVQALTNNFLTDLHMTTNGEFLILRTFCCHAHNISYRLQPGKFSLYLVVHVC